MENNKKSVQLFFSPADNLSPMVIFELKTEFIELYKLLKITGVCGSGAEAKQLITSGQVHVNDTKEIRKGNKIRPGSKVSVNDITIEVRKTEVPPQSCC